MVHEPDGEPSAFGTHELFRLDGRRVLVTGAARGLGLGMATAFAEAGAGVALADVDGEGLASARAAVDERCAGRARATCLTCDVRDPAQVDDAVEQAVAALGGLDVVVNDAAVYPTAPLAEAPDEHLQGVLDVNVAGCARVVRAARPALVESGRGRVVNVASITFFLGVPAGLGAYVASKGAVIGLTRALARELGPEAVTVNAIAPGAFPTRAEDIHEDRDAFDRRVLANQCVKRRGRVEDIAGAALFLASDAASFITGQTLVVDGGWVFG